MNTIQDHDYVSSLPPREPSGVSRDAIQGCTDTGYVSRVAPVEHNPDWFTSPQS